MSFASINLDSKPWEDFFARYRGEPASSYVGMQEFMLPRRQSMAGNTPALPSTSVATIYDFANEDAHERVAPLRIAFEALQDDALRLCEHLPKK